MGTPGVIMAATEFGKLLLQMWINYKENVGLTEEQAKQAFDNVFGPFMDASANPVDPVKE